MEKIKLFLESDKGKDFLVVLIIILVGIGSFSLGRLSKNGQNGGMNIKYENQEANIIKSLKYGPNDDLGVKDNIIEELKPLNQLNNSDSKNFFASSRGSKYYSLDCSGGKTIKQENRIYFNTKEEAENAGYELSSSCE